MYITHKMMPNIRNLVVSELELRVTLTLLVRGWRKPMENRLEGCNLTLRAITPRIPARYCSLDTLYIVYNAMYIDFTTHGGGKYWTSGI